MKARHQRPCTDLAQLLRDKAPPKPACFRSQEDWVSYLHQAETSGEVRVLLYAGRTGKGEANRGRIKTENINPHIDFCSDCTHQRHIEMQAQARCHPPAWGTVPEDKSKAAKAPAPKISAAQMRAAKRLPMVSVVACNTSTWGVRAFADINDVTKAGFVIDAVRIAIQSGQAYRGHLWKLADDFRRNPPALPKAGDALAAFVSHATDSQLRLELGKNDS